jgi:hypothetical protein
MLAIAHVLECTSEDGGRAAPPLERQHDSVELIRRLLFTDGHGHHPDALEVIWQSTHRVLEWENVRGIEAAERAALDPRQPFDRAWGAAARLFGLSSTPLLRLPAAGDYRLNVVMLNEPSVLLRGAPVTDEGQLLYDIGAALAGTLPPFAILNAATYEQINDLFLAVASAFGPAEASRTSFTSTARLAGLLWESLPPRTQRRMTEWCRDGKLSRENAVAAARRAARRAGLFISGSLSEALSRVASDEGIPREVIAGRDGLERLCEQSRAALDLVRLAIDPMYAHLRWRADLRQRASGAHWRRA